MTLRGSAIAIVLGTALGLTGCTTVGQRRPTALPPATAPLAGPTAGRPAATRPGAAPATAATAPAPAVAQARAGGLGLFSRRANRRAMLVAAALAQRSQTSPTLARYFPGLAAPGQATREPARPSYSSPAARSLDSTERRALAMRTPAYRNLARTKAPVDPPVLPVALNIQVYPDDTPPRDPTRLADRTEPELSADAATAEEAPRAVSQPDDALKRRGLDPYDPTGLADRPEPVPIAPEVVESNAPPTGPEPEPSHEPAAESVASTVPPPVAEADEPVRESARPASEAPHVAVAKPIGLSPEPDATVPETRRARPLGSPSRFTTDLFPPSYYDKDEPGQPRDDLVEPARAPARPHLLRRFRERVTARLESAIVRATRPAASAAPRTVSSGGADRDKMPPSATLP